MSRANSKIALKTPTIVLAALAYSLLSVFIVFHIYPSPVFFAIDHAKHLYIICDTTTAW